MNIQIISASAGSGKTYRLAELLEEEVRKGKVRPDAILATTFTKKAAVELQERVRTKLLTSGLTTEAQQLAASRIGTVNSVCGSLLADFAFDLGISPSQTVINEEAVTGVIARAISRIIDKKTSQELKELSQYFPGTKIRNVVADIIVKARANRLTSMELRQCGERTGQDFLELFGNPTGNGVKLDQELKHGLNIFLKAVDLEIDKTKATQKALEKVQKLKNKLQFSKRLSWCDWLNLTKISTGAKSREAAETLSGIAGQHDKHPGLRQNVTRLINLVFELAAQTLTSYQSYKDQWGVVDFIDQEALALDLLEMKRPTEILRDQLDLVLVDEFQDTSPMQLAIFLKLAQFANKSVWVGDQKQSIYGFRDADPSLMDVAIAGILKGQEPETLTKSWRSRPDLVRSTSDIFAEPFQSQGLPEQRVRLEPANKVINEEPDNLSTVYEYWQLNSSNKENDARSLASAVSELLLATDNTIRDVQTGQKRSALAGDIVILCRTNNVCVQVAEALEEQCIKAALPRPGLLDCPEIVVTLAGLRLLIDPMDSLARAEIARLIDNPADNNEFLRKALAKPFAQGFELELFVKLELARKNLHLAGPLEIFDTAMENIGVRNFCLAWGDAAARLANLDTLRSYCVSYVDECLTASQGTSATGMLAWLENKESVNKAVVLSGNTVQVLTWHKAKGLEWPITVLYQLDKVYPALPLGVNVVSDTEFNLKDPLAGRWIRYWPDPYLDPSNPFANFSSGAPFHDRLNQNQATLDHSHKEQRQELRLLYVGWTRARDKVVLAGRKDFLQKGILRLLVNKAGDHLLKAPENGVVTWGGRKLAVTSRIVKPTEPLVKTIQTGSGYKESGPQDYPPAFLAASSISGHGTITSIESIGEYLSLTGKPNMQQLGEAIHTFLGADDVNTDNTKRFKMAQNILNRWQVGINMTAEDLLYASDRLHTWVNAKWPKAIWHREYPVALRQKIGTIVCGFIDLLLETPLGFVIIDHKSFPGNSEEAQKKAATFAGQLWVYTEAVEVATGKGVESCFIHLPVTGLMAEITRKNFAE